MARLTLPILALVLGAGAAFALVACGEEDAKLLPGETAREIRENLGSVQTLVDEGECSEAEGAALEVSTQVESLEGIDAKLKQALEDGAAKLNEVVVRCEEEAEEEALEEAEAEEAEAEAEEPEEKKEKPKKEKPGKEDEEGDEGPAEEIPPPHSKGKGKGPEEAPETPEPPAETPSGGIGPGAEAGPEG